MKSRVTRAFRESLLWLPEAVQRQAARAYSLWQTDPHHPSLQFKRVSPSEPIYSVRVGRGYSALGVMSGDDVLWFSIGSHAEYDALFRRL